MKTRKLSAHANKPKRGRPASGKPRSEIELAATQKHTQKLIASGRVRIVAYVLEETKNSLSSIKNNLGVKTQGEVFDFLAAEEIKRIESSE